VRNHLIDARPLPADQEPAGELLRECPGLLLSEHSSDEKRMTVRRVDVTPEGCGSCSAASGTEHAKPLMFPPVGRLAAVTARPRWCFTPGLLHRRGPPTCTSATSTSAPHLASTGPGGGAGAHLSRAVSTTGRTPHITHRRRSGPRRRLLPSKARPVSGSFIRFRGSSPTNETEAPGRARARPLTSTGPPGWRWVGNLRPPGTEVVDPPPPGSKPK